MKSAIVLCVLASAVVAMARPELYSDKYDNVDLDEIISNLRVFESYYNCVMETGNCTPDGKELKGHIKDALETGCSKCTEAQQNGTRKVMKQLVNNQQAWWKALTDKYDPDKKYTTKYEKELKELSA